MKTRRGNGYDKLAGHTHHHHLDPLSWAFCQHEWSSTSLSWQCKHETHARTHTYARTKGDRIHTTHTHRHAPTYAHTRTHIRPRETYRKRGTNVLKVATQGGAKASAAALAMLTNTGNKDHGAATIRAARGVVVVQGGVDGVERVVDNQTVKVKPVQVGGVRIVLGKGHRTRLPQRRPHALVKPPPLSPE